MELFLQQFFSGIALGGIYSILALALVMIFKASRDINFALGEMAMFSTYIAWWMITNGVPYWWAFIFTVIVSFFFGLFLERWIYRPFEKASHLVHLMVFIGLLLIINGLAGWIFGYELQEFPSPFSETIFPKNPYIGAHEMGVICVSICVMILLSIFFRCTNVGLCMRGTAENQESSRLVGIRVGWMLALAWGIAASIGAIAGMLSAPTLFLDPNMMGGVLLYSLAGAILGGITSPAGAVLGGLCMGVTENLAGTYLPFIGNELKLPFALFIILLVMAVRPEGIFGKTLVRRV